MNETLIKKIEGLGWRVEDEGSGDYHLSKYSNAGQDFGINIEGESDEELIQSIGEFHENFDPSEEAYLWLDDSGHGKNGAPYEMEDVLKDMKDCRGMVFELYKALR